MSHDHDVVARGEDVTASGAHHRKQAPNPFRGRGACLPFENAPAWPKSQPPPESREEPSKQPQACPIPNAHAEQLRSWLIRPRCVNPRFISVRCDNRTRIRGLTGDTTHDLEVRLRLLRRLGRDAQDLLGGKGARIAEMARIGPPVRVPAGFTITTEACVAYMRGGDASRGTRRPGRRGRRTPGGAGRQAARRSRRPAAGLGALRSARLDAGNDGHGPQPRAERRRRSRAWPRRTGNERFAWDSYRRFLQMFGNVVRGIDARRYRAGDRGREDSARRRARHGARSPTICVSLRATSSGSSGADGRGVPGGSSGAASPGDRGGVRLLERRARGRVPAAEPDSRRLGDRGQRPADGLRQHGDEFRLGGRLQPRPAHRRTGAVGRLPGSTPRARMSSRACATPGISPSWPS